MPPSCLMRATVASSISDAIPQHVPGRGLDQERALADAEPGLGVDRVEPRLLFLDQVPVAGPEGLERRPALAFRTDVLPLILADRTAPRGGGRFRELGPAGHAKERRARGDLARMHLRRVENFLAVHRCRLLPGMVPGWSSRVTIPVR